MSLESVDKQTHDEMCCTLAALVLYDDGIEVTADKINKLIAASGNKIESYWAPLFAKALQGKNIGDLLVGGGPAPSGGSTTSAPAESKEYII
jgi:large subunit ribosomal protein LP1